MFIVYGPVYFFFNCAECERRNSVFVQAAIFPTNKRSSYVSNRFFQRITSFGNN